MNDVGLAAGLRLTEPPVLSRSAVLRDEPLRIERERQLRGWPAARLVVVDHDGRTPVEWRDTPAAGFRVGDAGTWDVAFGSGGRLRTRATTGDAPPDDAVLLGEQDGVAYWGLRGGIDPGSGDDPVEWVDLRMAGAALDALGAGLFTTAVAVLNWHDAARFCARDGSPTRTGHAGWHRRCEAAGHEEYPRTDPAVICLVHDGGGQVLLSRNVGWPEGRFSVQAGFVEAGESLEACVQREIHEEVGVRVDDVRYLGSQAWPFPRSVMIGFHAVADPAVPLHAADGEIAEAMWVTRQELVAALSRGDWSEPNDPTAATTAAATTAAATTAAATTTAATTAASERSEQRRRRLLLPGKVSIARSMLESWAAAS